jgi:hypothetical protein
MTPELELKAAVEQYAKTANLLHFEATVKVLDGECKDVWVTRKIHFEAMKVKRNN